MRKEFELYGKCGWSYRMPSTYIRNNKGISTNGIIFKIKNYHNLIEKNFHETSIGLSDMLK